MRPWPLFALLIPLNLLPASLTADESSAPEALTTVDPQIPVEELEVILKPLTRGQLVVETNAWQGLVQTKAEQIAAAEVIVRRQNNEIAEAAAVREQAELAKERLEAVRTQAEEASASGDPDAIADVQEAAREAKEQMTEVQAHVDAAAGAAERTAAMRERIGELQQDGADAGAEDLAQTAEDAAGRVADAQDAIDQAIEQVGSDELVDAVREARSATDQAAAATAAVSAQADAAAEAATEAEAGAEALVADGEASPKLLARAEALAAAEEAKRQEKRILLETVANMREERKVLVDRLKAALAALEAKTADSDADTLALITDHRLYIRAISGVDVDVQDTTSAWIAIKGWVTSEEGGIRLGLNLLRFFGVLIAAWVLSRLLSAGIHRGLRRVRGTSRLLEDFLVKMTRWVVMAVGVIMALAALEVSVGPLLAVVGAAGFVIAFALQDSLSNFASGIMILLFRPFDVGDVVDAGGASGSVKSMNLISTTIKTFDNKIMVVPNNKIFGDVITNATGVGERRVDMEFGIAYDADIDQAQAILEEVIGAHPQVLKDPAPTIALHTLGDSSVNFIVRPWTRTADYWGVYWDITKTVKKRFDAAGIGIPFPQRDVHLYLHGSAEQLVAKQGG